MPLYQSSVLKKHLADLDATKVQAAFAVFQQHFANPVRQENIRQAKEEQYQEGFLRDLFVEVLGYTLNPSPGFDLTTEFKNQTDAKKADGAIMLKGAALGVIELKGTNTTDFKKIEDQAFRYKNNHKGCRYVVTSNFERLRFYIDDATDFEEWDLFRLDAEQFALLYLCLAQTQVLANLPLKIKESSAYRQWLLQITILDPACGSGAFLNQAFNFLIEEHRRLDQLQASLFGDALVLTDVDNAILEHNLFGVDLNEESVEIAQLALWLRTAKKGRKLSALSHNIRHGNSLIDDPAVAGDAAFNWQEAFPEVFANGGFDVVVGNPPYGASLDSTTKLVFNNLYQSFQKNNDIYTCFLEKINFLINENGTCGYIIPVSWQTGDNYIDTRKFFLKNYELKIGIKLPYDVFTDAYVDTGIYIFRKRKGGEYEAAVFEYPVRFDLRDLKSTTDFKKLPSSKWENHGQLNLVLNPDFYGLDFSKNTVPLESISDSIRGILPGKGDISTTKDDRFSKPYFVGDVYRYEIYESYEFVHYGSHLKEKPSHYSWFEGVRILVRRLINRQFRLMATYVENEFVNKKDLYILKIIDPNISPKFILGIINSKLVSYYKTKGSTTATKDDFSQLTLSDIRSLPVPLVSNEVQVAIVQQVNLILSQKKQLNTLTTQFLTLLTSKSPSLNPTKKLKSWPDLSFTEFLKELKKQKIAWSLKEEAEWLEYFTQEQAAAQVLQQQIDVTDREIDRLVYALYELTEEEIALVEG